MKTSFLASLVALLAGVWVAPAQAADHPGKSVYDATCVACHGTGAAGSPKFGDAGAWAPRLKAGVPALIASVKNGKGAMPPRGGNATLTDAQIEASVRYMVEQVQPAAAAAAKPGAKPAESTKSAAAKPATEPAKPAAEPGKAAAPATAAAGGGAGKTVYDATCAACHATGAAGAPKLGDAGAWKPRLAGGIPALVNSARNGKGVMPPKGGNASLTDAQLEAAVRYMVDAAAAPGGATAAAPAAPAAPPTQTAQAAPATQRPVGEGNRPLPTPGAAAPPPAAPAAPAASAAPGGATGATANQFNRLLRSQGQRNRPPAEDGIHDPANDGTLALQPPLAAFDALPRSNAGNRVDWVKSLNENKIAPRADKVDAKVEPMVMDLNVVREVKGSMPDVVYPHKQHTQWLDCSNCHPAIFKPQKGANQISMASILLGQACGTCHGKVAFPVSECRLCHSRPKGAATAATGTPTATAPAAPAPTTAK